MTLVFLNAKKYALLDRTVGFVVASRVGTTLSMGGVREASHASPNPSHLSPAPDKEPPPNKSCMAPRAHVRKIFNLGCTRISHTLGALPGFRLPSPTQPLPGTMARLATTTSRHSFLSACVFCAFFLPPLFVSFWGVRPGVLLRRASPSGLRVMRAGVA